MSDSGAGVAPKTETEAETKRRVRLGILLGILMAMMAASSFSVARGGILNGVRPEEIVLLRFGVAGLIFLPVLIKRGVLTLAGVGWRRSFFLFLTAGPGAAFLQVNGYLYAPLAHGAVIVPMSVTVFCSVMAIVLLKERQGLAYMIGTAGIVFGLVLISGEGVLHSHAGASVWIGDLMFIGAGILWASYTLLFRIWRLDSISAMAATCVLSLVTLLIAFPVAFSVPHLLSLPPHQLLLQAVVQGLFSGTIATIAYNRVVDLLGAGRAVLFPAMVPGLAIVVGIPVLGEVPTVVQLLGLGSAMIGLMIALGLLRFPRLRR